MVNDRQQLNFFDFDHNTESIIISIRQVELNPPAYWAEAAGWLGMGTTRLKAVKKLQAAISNNLGVIFQVSKGDSPIPPFEKHNLREHII